jgi:hypothetical protein
MKQLLINSTLILFIAVLNGCTQIAYPLRMDLGIANLTTDSLRIDTYPYIYGPETKFIVEERIDTTYIHVWRHPPMAINARVLRHDTPFNRPDTIGERMGMYLMHPNSAMVISSLNKLIFVNGTDTVRLRSKEDILKHSVPFNRFPKPKGKQQRFII